MIYSSSQNKVGCTAVFVWVFVSIIAIADTALAHKVIGSISAENTLPVATFQFDDGAALSYAQLKIWAPGSEKIEFQNGRTDSNGRFSFVPDRKGIWRILVADGLGHAATIEYLVENDLKTTDRVNKAQTNMLLCTILGVSLIVNLALAIKMRKA